mmetsp:Transcript_12845/g.34587  ORF Transcript_12845/g.34587 Transcript_12845/m.34587 type:complete len:239 (-) Transcript_12845:94-810(-)
MPQNKMLPYIDRTPMRNGDRFLVTIARYHGFVVREPLALERFSKCGRLRVDPAVLCDLTAPVHNHLGILAQRHVRRVPTGVGSPPVMVLGLLGNFGWRRHHLANCVYECHESGLVSSGKRIRELKSKNPPTMRIRNSSDRSNARKDAGVAVLRRTNVHVAHKLALEWAGGNLNLARAVRPIVSNFDLHLSLHNRSVKTQQASHLHVHDHRGLQPGIFRHLRRCHRRRHCRRRRRQQRQ